jgi:hypothetical protein
MSKESRSRDSEVVILNWMTPLVSTTRVSVALSLFRHRVISSPVSFPTESIFSPHIPANRRIACTCIDLHAVKLEPRIDAYGCWHAHFFEADPVIMIA